MNVVLVTFNDGRTERIESKFFLKVTADADKDTLIVEENVLTKNMAENQLTLAVPVRLTPGSVVPGDIEEMASVYRTVFGARFRETKFWRENREEDKTTSDSVPCHRGDVESGGCS